MIVTIFDTETDGFYKEGVPLTDKPNAVQLAAVMYLDKRPIGHLSAVLRHTRPIPQGATDVHKIETEMMETVGHYPSLILDHFNRMVMMSDKIVAHNAAFDLNIIRTGYEKMGQPTSVKNLAEAKVTCTMNSLIDECNLPPKFAGARPKWPNLQEAYTHFYGKGFKGAHDAMVDVRACAAVYFAMLGNGIPELGPVT